MSVKILDNVNSPEVRELKAEILAKRIIGNVLFEVKQISSDVSIARVENLTAILDLFVTQMGYAGIGDRWQEITPEAANKILLFVLTKDLAYSSKIMPLAEAEKISAKVFHFFPDGCKFFTNALFVNNYSALSAWDSLTTATFDTGVMFVSDALLGILWVRDED